MYIVSQIIAKNTTNFLQVSPSLNPFFAILQIFKQEIHVKKRNFKMIRIEFINTLNEAEEQHIYALAKKARVSDAKGVPIKLRKLMKDLKRKKKKISFHVKRQSIDEIEKTLIFKMIPFVRKEHYQHKKVTEGVLFDGVKIIDVIYDKEGTLMCKNKGVIEAIELLEDDQEIKALVVLNQFAIRDDLENIPRLSVPVSD